jgi:4-hydroxybenzoate polyprenyltransferase
LLNPLSDSTRPDAVLSDQNGPDSRTALVLDLDGTLCRSDTLHEALVGVAAHRPLELPSVLVALTQGKAAFKKAVADHCVVPGGLLPYNQDVLDLAHAARAEGRRVVLVSASDQRQVDAVAEHLEIFDEAIGTGGADSAANVNLGGAHKADLLVARFGEGGFDYAGDRSVDLEVWARARRVITVGADSGLRHKAGALDAQAVHLPGGAGSVAKGLLRAMRPHQWLKNILVFLPMVAAHDTSLLGQAMAAFVAFCLLASSVYLFNDLVDLQADREHPRKRFRPFAAGDVPVMTGVAVGAGLFVAAVLVAVLFTPPAFPAVLAVYYVATFLYSLWLKRKLIVDVLTLASLYTLRIIAGAAATSVFLSPWMLGFSMFLFLSLAAVKRQAELMDQLRDGREKTAGRAYLTEDLPVLRGMALSSGYAAVMVFALYINSADVRGLYNLPEALWLICPLLLYWISRMVMMTHRGYMNDDPIVYTARDRTSLLVILLCFAVVVIATLA